MSKNLLSVSIIVFFIGMAGSITGLFKEIFVAHQFGTHTSIDIFYLGLSIPLFLAALFSSAINATVIPAYLQAKQDNTQVSFFLDTAKITLGFLTGLSGLSALFIAYVQPYLLGLSAEKSHLVVQAGLILSPLILLQGLSSYLDGILNAEKKIILNNLLSILIPLGTIVILMFSSYYGFIILCIGLYLGYIAKLIGQILIIRQIFLFHHNVISQPLVIKQYYGVISEFFWLVFSSAILGLLPVISNYYASYLSTGSVASLNYANKLLNTGLVLVGIIINSVLFPHIAEAIVKNKYQGIQLGIKLSLYSVILFALLLFPVYLLSEPIIQLFFERGQFTHQSTLEVAFILKYLLLYIPFYVAGLLLSRLVVSLNLARIFILGNIISLLLFAGSGWLLIQYYHQGIESLGIAYTLVYTVSALYLFLHIYKHPVRIAHAH